jgi:glycosyltransferase involved in cell wall biosynthesis
VSLVIYGEGECSKELAAQVVSLGLQDSVEFKGHLSHLELAAHIRDADIGVVPNRPDSHIHMAYPTKLFEFVQMGVPVVATRTRILERRFDDKALLFVDPTAEGVASGILRAYQDPAGARDAASRARELLEPVSWEHMRRDYVDCIERVCTASMSPGRTS